MERIYTIIVVVIFAVSVYITLIHYTTPYVPSVMKGYGKKDESVSVLLDRIQWSNHYPARLNIAVRYGFYAVLISFLASVIYEQKTSPRNLLMCTIVIWMVLMGAHSFFVHHSDKFTSYFIDDNLKHIRTKLNLESSLENLTVHQTKFPRNHDCTNFVYNIDNLKQQDKEIKCDS